LLHGLRRVKLNEIMLRSYVALEIVCGILLLPDEGYPDAILPYRNRRLDSFLQYRNT